MCQEPGGGAPDIDSCTSAGLFFAVTPVTYSTFFHLPRRSLEDFVGTATQPPSESSNGHDEIYRGLSRGRSRSPYGSADSVPTAERSALKSKVVPGRVSRRGPAAGGRWRSSARPPCLPGTAIKNKTPPRRAGIAGRILVREWRPSCACCCRPRTRTVLNGARGPTPGSGPRARTSLPVS